MDQAPGPDVTAEVEAFVRDLAGDREAAAGLTRDVDLFDAGILDSYGGVRLITFVEERYGIVLADTDLLDDRFGSIDGISAIVRARLAG
jgi:acyl carrier protein